MGNEKEKRGPIVLVLSQGAYRILRKYWGKRSQCCGKERGKGKRELQKRTPGSAVANAGTQNHFVKGR